jgi:hypothetical protein
VSRRELRAALVAAAVSGIPSTTHALATGGDPLQATRAAGALVVGERAPRRAQILAAAPVHLAVSLLWTVVLARTLPPARRPGYGAAGGLAIAALDLGVIGRRNPAIRRLPLIPQLADHALFGAVVGALTGRDRP